MYVPPFVLIYPNFFTPTPSTTRLCLPVCQILRHVSTPVKVVYKKKKVIHVKVSRLPPHPTYCGFHSMCHHSSTTELGRFSVLTRSQVSSSVHSLSVVVKRKLKDTQLSWESTV